MPIRKISLHKSLSPLILDFNSHISLPRWKNNSGSTPLNVFLFPYFQTAPSKHSRSVLCQSEYFYLLKPTGYVMHQQFNIKQLYALPTKCIYVFCIYLRTNSDLCHLQHKLNGFFFYNWDEKCLQRGTNWVIKLSSLRFIFKGLI